MSRITRMRTSFTNYTNENKFSRMTRICYAQVSLIAAKIANLFIAKAHENRELREISFFVYIPRFRILSLFRMFSQSQTSFRNPKHVFAIANMLLSIRIRAIRDIRLNSLLKRKGGRA